MEDDKIYYRHGETIDGYRYTIAGQFSKNSYSEPLLNMAIAVCSKKDQFCKALGRIKSRAKLLGKSKTGRHIINISFSSQFGPDMTDREIWIVASDINEPTREQLFALFGMKCFKNKGS